MEAKLLNKHINYEQDYIMIDNQIYSYAYVVERFKELKEKELELEKENKTLTKFYKYPFGLKTKVNEAVKELLQNLNLKTTKNIFENHDVANELLFYFLNNINTKMSVVEDRVYHLKYDKEEINKNSKLVEKAYNTKLYNKEKAYKKQKSLIKKINKQTEKQNIKMLFNTLVRKKTSNQDETYTFLYLLNKLNVDAYKLTLRNKKQNQTYSLLLVPVKKNNYEKEKYVCYDISYYRMQLKHSLLNNKNQENSYKLVLQSKDDLLKQYEAFEPVSLETTNKAYFKEEPEFNKIIKKIDNKKQEINITLP